MPIGNPLAYLLQGPTGYGDTGVRDPLAGGLSSGRASGGGFQMRNPFGGLGGGGQTQQSGASLGGNGGYNAVMDPSRRGIFGFLGRMAGLQTREEHIFEESGQQANAGFRAIQERIEGGMSPQQAIVDFVGSPEGMDFFATVPDPVNAIQNYLKSVAPPELADPMIVGQGADVWDPNQGQVVHSNDAPQDPYTLNPNDRRFDENNELVAVGAEPVPNAPDDLVKFQAFAELAGLSPDEKKQLANVMIQKMAMPAGGDPTQAEAALSALVKSGKITEETKLLMLGGAIQVMPRRDQFGDIEGYDVVDTVGGSVQSLNSATPQDPSPLAPTASPGRTPGTRPGEMPDALNQLENPADIVEGVGMVPKLQQMFGGLFGQYNPQWGTPEEVTVRRQALANINLDAQNLRDILSNSRSSAAETKRIETILEPLSGFGRSPVDAAVALIEWGQYIDTRMGIAMETRSDPKTSKDARQNAEAEIQALKRAKAHVPPEKALMEKLVELQAAEGPIPAAIPGAIEQGEDILGAAGGDVEGAPEAAPLEFKTEAELDKAIKAGKVKAGQRVILNGRAGTIGE